MPALKKSLVTLLVLALVGGGSYYYLQKRAAAKKKSPLKFETADVTRGDITAKVTASGTLSALVTVQVGSQVSGRLKEIYVDYNSPVKKGQKIAKIDPELLETALLQARANQEAAAADLTKARVTAADSRRQYERTKTLADQGLVARADSDTALATANAADAAVLSAAGKLSQARAALRQAQVNLDYTDIVSPTNGVVISRNVDVGQTVAASLQAPVLFTIAEDLSKMQVDTSVAEADIGRITAGMAAWFTVDAYPKTRFDGVVRQIRNSPQTLQNVVTYDAVIDVANPNLVLRPGMTANVTFVYAQKRSVLRVPKSALRFRPADDILALLDGGAGGGTKKTGGTMAGKRQQGAATAPAGAGAATGSSGRRPGRGEGRPEAADETDDRSTVWVLKGEKPVAVKIVTGISDGSLAELVEGPLKDGDHLVTDVTNTTAADKGPGFRRMF